MKSMVALEAEWLNARAQMLDPPVRPLHPLRVPMPLAAQGRLIVWPLTLCDRKKRCPTYSHRAKIV
jgi:hypothetical protein